MMDDVIEVAIDARDEVWETFRALHQGDRVSNRTSWELERRAMKAAIRAADEARAEDVAA